MARLGLSDRHMDIEHANEGVLECQLVGIAGDPKRIQRVCRLRPRNPRKTRCRDRQRDDNQNAFFHASSKLDLKT
jgi:hypothetical protein